MRNICMIAAIGENNALGKENDLIWHLPDDFKRFKALTTGHKIIMGRKTFESLRKPLPNRTHIIITRDSTFDPQFPDILVVHSMEDALSLAKDEAVVFIIGGGEIYTLGMPYATTLEITRVHNSFEADTFFPDIAEQDWVLEKQEFHPKDERHAYDFTYQTFSRK